MTLGRGQLGEAFFNNLSDCPLLTQLVVCDAALGNGVQEISINHDRLQHLQVTKCRVLRVSVRWDHSNSIYLSDPFKNSTYYCKLIFDIVQVSKTCDFIF